MVSPSAPSSSVATSSSMSSARSSNSSITSRYPSTISSSIRYRRKPIPSFDRSGALSSRVPTLPKSNRRLTPDRRDVQSPAREQVHLPIDDLALLVQVDPVRDEEQVLRVEVDLRALVPPAAVLDRELVEAELGLELGELVVGGVDDVDPDALVARAGLVDGPRVERLLDLQRAIVVDATGDHGGASLSQALRRTSARGRLEPFAPAAAAKMAAWPTSNRSCASGARTTTCSSGPRPGGGARSSRTRGSRRSRSRTTRGSRPGSPSGSRRSRTRSSPRCARAAASARTS